MRKAGTVILGLSVVLWAMMTYPGLSEERAAGFADTRSRLTEFCLASPEMRGMVGSEHDLEELGRL